MKKNKIRVISAVVSAIMLASSASAFAKFDAYNDPDGFTLGHYEAEDESGTTCRYRKII